MYIGSNVILVGNEVHNTGVLPATNEFLSGMTNFASSSQDKINLRVG